MIEAQSVEPELEVTEDDEEEAYVSYDIASYPSDLTLAGILQMWEGNDIIIPEFQRSFVWNIQQASLLIESFLLGLPVPQVFFYVEPDNKVLIIDGQQRILSVIYFFSGFFKGENVQGKRQVFRLTGLHEKSPFQGVRYEDLPDEAKRKLKGSVLRAINIKQLTPKGENTSVYHIFERLNTGGTPLKPQEIRNCVFRGDFVTILRDLNKNKHWREIIGSMQEDRHQKDVELLLRVFSLSAANWQQYEKPMKQYLNMAMNENKNGTSARVTSFKKRFVKATAAVIEHLGKKPFHIRGPLNSSALDAVLVTLIDNHSQIPEDLGARYKTLLRDPSFFTTTYYGTSDVTVLRSRFAKAREILIG